MSPARISHQAALKTDGAFVRWNKATMIKDTMCYSSMPITDQASRRVRKLALLFFATLFQVTTLAAVDKPHPLITVKCDAEADVLTITNALLKDEKGVKSNEIDADHSYSPWDMVDVARRTDSTRIIKSTKASTNCQLSSGEYKIIVEPQIFSKDLDDRCGETISGAVTIMRDGIEVLERTAFEEYCHGNIPVITRITVFGKTGEHKIKRIPKSRFY